LFSAATFAEYPKVIKSLSLKLKFHLGGWRAEGENDEGRRSQRV
jgi:hypothetical protein